MSKILLYHGVTDWKKEPRDGTFLNYNGKHIDLFEFERQMEWLSKNKRVVKLTDWIQYRPKDDVAITFDDSYENLYHNFLLKNIIYQHFLFQQGLLMI